MMVVTEVDLQDIQRSLVSIIQYNNQLVYEHSIRVSCFAAGIAQTLGLPQHQMEKLYCAALLHDIGKLGIPNVILEKPGKLDAKEYDIIKSHPSIAYEILSPLKISEEVLDAILHHHERIDGFGYPDCLHADNISSYAKIIAVADSFDAMTSQRPYRQPLSRQDAIAELLRHVDKQFDYTIVTAFLDYLHHLNSL